MPRKRTPGNIERLENCYRVRLSVAGERHYFTLPTTERAAAVDFAKKKHAELAELGRRRAAAGIEGRMRISALLELFESEALPTLTEGTQRAYGDTLKPVRTYFVDELADPPLENVQAKHVEAYLAWRRVHRLGRGGVVKHGRRRRDPDKAPTPPDPVTNRTLAKDRAVLHRLFALAVRRELLAANPVARTEAPKVDAHNPVILSPDQYEALVEACGDRPMLSLFVQTLGESGMRCESEALWLQWQDVDLAEGFLWIASGRGGHRTKSGKGRWVPMTERLAAAMKDHFARFHFATYAGDRSPWIFHHEFTRRHHKAGARITSMRHSFAAAADRAELPEGFRQHDLRHRRVTTWLAEEQSAALVQAAMGHADMRTTLAYSHLARTDLKALVAPAKTPNVPANVPAGQIAGSIPPASASA